MKFRFVIGVLALPFLLAACGGGYKMVEERADNTTSFIYGYIDMEEAPTRLESFTIRQIAPDTESPYWHVRIHDGIFYMENVPPGSYQFMKFGGPGGRSSEVSYYSFQFPTGIKTFRVRNAGIYFLGSYKFKKTGTDENRKFDIERTSMPGKRDLMGRLLPYTAGTRWEAQLSRYIERPL